MTFDFDQPIDRRRTNCLKWDGMEARFGISPDDGLAMWVADMDFPSPPAVNATLHSLAEHGVHGYYGNDDAYKAAIINWMANRYDWAVDPDWILTAPGLVSGIAMILQALTDPGDGIVLFTPVYHAFHRIIRANDRRIVESPLMRQQDGRYHMDLEGLRGALDGSERMVILCSPHNPGGRVWSAEELQALATLCAERDMILMSDEVHMDLTYPGHTHRVTATVAPEVADRMVTLTGPAKSFSVNGALIGQIIVSDAAIRAKIAKRLSASGLGTNRLSAMMCTAAYAHGGDWLDGLMRYLDGNRRLFEEHMNAIPGITCMPMEATYLAWVDFTETGLSREDFTRRVEQYARIAANHGPDFGSGGDSFLRFNIGTRNAIVAHALERLEHAFADLK